jgi:hypothetical protein
VLQLRELMRQDDSRRDAQRRAAHEQALADQAARIHYQQRR